MNHLDSGFLSRMGHNKWGHKVMCEENLPASEGEDCGSISDLNSGVFNRCETHLPQKWRVI